MVHVHCIRTDICTFRWTVADKRREKRGREGRERERVETDVPLEQESGGPLRVCVCVCGMDGGCLHNRFPLLGREGESGDVGVEECLAGAAGICDEVFGGIVEGALRVECLCRLHKRPL